MSGTLSPLFTWRSAIARSELSSTIKVTALMLSLHMNEMGGSCFPSVATLQKETSLSERAVRDSLRALEAGEWLKTTLGGGTKSSFYEASIPGHVVPPSPPLPRQQVPPTGAQGAPKGVIEDVLKDSEFKCHHCDGLAFKGPRGLAQHLRNVHDIEEGVPA